MDNAMDNDTTKEQTSKEQTPKEQFDAAMADLRAIIKRMQDGYYSNRYQRKCKEIQAEMGVEKDG